MESKNKFEELTDLINHYSNNKDSFDPKELQTMREDISLCLFYLSDMASKALSNHDKADHIRKTAMAEKEQEYRESLGSDGKPMTVAEAKNKARVDCKDLAIKVSESLRQKERVRIIISSVNTILHAISSRLKIIERK